MPTSIHMSPSSFPSLPPRIRRGIAIHPLSVKIRNDPAENDSSMTNSEIREMRKYHREPVGGRRWAVMTAEKARLLRKELRVTNCWPEIMFHSAVAVRLAFPADIYRWTSNSLPFHCEICSYYVVNLSWTCTSYVHALYIADMLSKLIVGSYIFIS